MRTNRIAGLLLILTSLGLFSCDNEVDLSAVTINGAVFESEIDAYSFVDITQYGSSLYNLSPTINGMPAPNLGGSQRYAISPFELPVVPGRTYTMSVEIEDQVFTDSVTVPGDFDFNTSSDTLYPVRFSSGTVTWTRSDSLARYYVKFLFITNLGREVPLDSGATGYQTAYDLPVLDSYGVYRLDVYSYHHGIYHPSQGHLVSYSTPEEWIPGGAWTAWLQRSLYFIVL